VRHVIWRCTPEEAHFFIDEFEKIPNLYIADGHHRTAAAYNVGKLKEARKKASGEEVTGEEPFNFFMTLFYPANNLMIMDYNRVLKTLNGMSSQEFITKLSQNFEINELPAASSSKPGALHKFSLYIEGKWYSMVLKE